MLTWLQMTLSLVVFLVPAAVALLWCLRGWKIALLAYGGAAGLAALAGGPEFGLEVAFGYGAIGLLLGRFLRRGRSATEVFLRVCGGFALAAGAAGLTWWVLGGREVHSIDEGLRGLLAGGFDQILEAGRAAGTVTETELATQRATVARLIELLIVIYPALLVFMLSMLVLVNMLIVRDVLAARLVPLPFAELTQWRAPEWLIWPVIACGFAAVFGRGTALFRPAVNLAIVSLVPFFFQGLAIASFFLKRWGMPRWLRGALYALAGSQAWLLVAAPLGLFDVWLDLRGRAGRRRREGTLPGPRAED